MAVLHRTKDPAVTEERADVGDHTAADGAPATERTAADGAPATERTAADGAPATERTTTHDTATTRQRRGWLRRRRDPNAPGVGLMAASAGAGAIATVARAIRLVAGIVVLIIALGIVFVALKASPSNTIVSHVHDWGRWLTTPFHNMFHVRGARGTLALNWGIAILVYLAVAWLITRMLLAPWRAVRRRRAATA
jgi:hypothetical protein